jgi:hypothetical protein
VISLTIASLFLSGCDLFKKKEELNGISPYGNLAGIWKTVTTPPTFYYYSDFCGTYQRVAKTQIGMQWTITKVTDSHVKIEIEPISFGPVQLLVPANCAVYSPLVAFESLDGYISSSQLTLKRNLEIVGSFSFTTDNLAGDFNSSFQKFCYGYCEGMDSDPRSVILVRQ